MYLVYGDIRKREGVQRGWTPEEGKCKCRYWNFLCLYASYIHTRTRLLSFDQDLRAEYSGITA
jgi:hypothetical protein